MIKQRKSKSRAHLVSLLEAVFGIRPPVGATGRKSSAGDGVCERLRLRLRQRNGGQSRRATDIDGSNYILS